MDSSQEKKTRAPCMGLQGPSFYLTFFDKKGHNSKTIAFNSFHSYAPCLSTVPCHDKQVFHVWC